MDGSGDGISRSVVSSVNSVIAVLRGDIAGTNSVGGAVSGAVTVVVLPPDGFTPRSVGLVIPLRQVGQSRSVIFNGLTPVTDRLVERLLHDIQISNSAGRNQE